jgi:hypothetical protein
MRDIDPIHDLELRRREARRAVDEAGGGEAEGFELAEQELIEHASHGDEHNTTPIMRDSENVSEERAAADGLYGEADEEHKADG